MACSLNLFAYLTGSPDPGGTWSETSGAPTYIGQGGTITGSWLGTIDTEGISPGTYTFNYTLSSGPCVDTSTVTVTVIEANAGTDASVQACETDTDVFILFDQIAPATPNGIWTGSTNSSGYNAGTPGVTDDTFSIAASEGAGTYTFVYQITPGALGSVNCDNCSDTATVTFNVVDQGDAGLDTTVDVCINCSFAMFLQFTPQPDAGGTWTETTASGPTYTGQGGVIGNGHLGSVTFFNLLENTYTFEYAVGAVGCQDTSIVTIIYDPVMAGVDVTFEHCQSTNQVRNIFNDLGGTPDTGGVWSGSGTGTAGYNANSTLPTDDTFSYASVPAGTYEFTYTVTQANAVLQGSCSNGDCVDSATVTYTLLGDPGSAGTPTNATLCSDSTCSFDLADQLSGEAAGGVWTDITNPLPSYISQGGTITGGDQGTVTFNAGFIDKVYRFQYTVSNICGSNTSVVEITKQSLTLGNNVVYNACAHENIPVNITTLMGVTEQPNTVYTLIDSGTQSAGYSTQGTSSVFDDTFNPFLAGVGNYDFLLTADNTTGICACSDTQVLTIVVNPSGNAGTTGFGKLCNNI